MSETVRSISKALYAVAILGIAVAAAAQSPIDQDWHQWSSDVCLKVLTDSPWVATAEVKNSKDVHRAVLLSSLLVRQAMLRQLQIQKKYDTMSPEKRQEFDDETSTCLTDPIYTQFIVIRAWGWPPGTPRSTGDADQLSILEHGAKVSPAYVWTLHDYSALSSCGDESFPWQYIPTAIDKEHEDWNRLHPGTLVPPDNKQLAPIPALEFQYPRSVNGKPLIQPGDRTMVFDWGEKGGRFTFHLADLIYKDKLDF
ncbi:MAG TPA: hypothetical protein VKR82_00595 [Candidatus Acidoferrales bacterium]|nr:hypothetical protein [Candidatus Acidoferrales bacterium]